MIHTHQHLPPWVVLNKVVGETPLERLEAWRSTQLHLRGVPLAYAGRLDPMASGKLLVLIGDTCKQQTDYHHLDKAYAVEVAVGISSDTGDVLGIISEADKQPNPDTNWPALAKPLIGEITLPYPHYSAKPVGGIPLHTWAVTGRINEVTVPTRTSTIYDLSVTGTNMLTRTTLTERAVQKIALLPTVTDARKALGNDFRRGDVLASWEQFRTRGTPDDTFAIVSFTCICSSGTYMRTLADVLAKQVDSRGLAFSIHRTDIGTYKSGTWLNRYT